MNKIYAISSTGKTEKSFLDLRFGKCENIIIYTTATEEVNILENPFKNEDHSGIHLVKFLQDKGVSTIITGEVGPKVSNLLEQEKMQLVLLHEEKIKIEEIIERIKKK
ncbi:Predicted Fe-Mo cluster-binding protein, NifX family [Mariniphaga anaerophila]|uniref:Predicted Fe-Mo cluster-binding protein, NifX family n=1 Tax=Mariniphaga anaerophila TaxID=1484053 RepID=A0A1M5E0Z1_9BACT|nr:NifB/NifX family molybdenum-iron cluster-binding protein [Mariniphaga anaerophila]SHF72836.1 Predicted Fe-Mo cluster-binding protein, NifX family [Mariniphaga anaerophila]